MEFRSMSKSQLNSTKEELQKKYDAFKAQGLKLNMARGKPGADQLDLSMKLLDVLTSDSAVKAVSGDDCRNYGLMEGLPEMQALLAAMMGVDADHVIAGGNSSLNLMFDFVSCGMTHGFSGCKPWGKQENIKFLCPAPGYDRHFAITEYFGFELITIPMSSDGPDMDLVEKLVADETVKGIWCVPKYSNPMGVTYSDETVGRLAALKPAAKDFRVLWDNAYCVHDLTETTDPLLNFWEECKKAGNPELAVHFASTSKITFPGSGISAMAAGEETLKVFRERMSFQTIGPDKLNQLRHVRYFKDLDGIKTHMVKHREILAPKFEAVLSLLERELGGKGVAQWTKPNGGYFVSVNVMNGCAKRVVALCKEAGVVLTGAGAAFPYGKDPDDTNIRLAPTFPPRRELEQAMELFCLCAQLAAAEKLLAD